MLILNAVLQRNSSGASPFALMTLTNLFAVDE